MAESLFPSTAAVHSDWPGLDKIKYLFVFGDSYSAIGYTHRSPPPTTEVPLGVPSYGLTYADGPNWVSILLAHNPGMVSSCYAVGGAMVPHVCIQIEDGFLPHAGQKPSWSPWTSDNGLFVTWVGVNDSAWAPPTSETMSPLFESEEALYKQGARNFLFINVPPMEFSPMAVDDGYFRKRTTAWNRELNDAIAAFVSAHPDCTIITFSAWNVFLDVLQNPATYDLPARSPKQSEIWFDHIHPSTKMHQVIADKVGEFLKSLPVSMHTEK